VAAPVTLSTLRVPWAGDATTATLVASSSSLPSGSVSLANTLMVTGVVPEVVAASSLAVGRLTITDTVPGAETAPGLSVTVYWRVSVPWKSPVAV